MGTEGAADKGGRPQGAEESQRLDLEPDIIHVRLSPLICGHPTTGTHPVKQFAKNFHCHPIGAK